MGALFSMLGGSGGGGLGMITGLIGGVMGFMGGQEAAAAASDEANRSAAVSTFQYQELMDKFTLASRIANRQTQQQIRTGQVARANAENAEVGQGGGGGQALQQGSTQGGVLGGISGAISTNINAISNQWETYGKLFKSQTNIFGEQLQMAADQSKIASAQGLMQEGNAIAGFGKAAGELLPTFGNMFNQVNANPVGMSTGNDIFSSQGAGAGLGGGL